MGENFRLVDQVEHGGTARHRGRDLPGRGTGSAGQSGGLSGRSRHLLERMGSAQALPGAEELTRALHGAGVPIAVATSSPRKFFERKTGHHAEWFSLFDAIITGDDPRIGKGKPAPDIFLLAADAIGANPAESLVVEDSPAGVTAGQAAGAQTLAVPHTGMDRSKLEHADMVVDSLADIGLADLGLVDSSAATTAD